MTERIDHAATAEAMLDGIGDLSNLFQVERAIAMAHVHGSLAVAEQQRIANLIALVAVPSDHFESLDRHPDVYTQIREGLGL